MRLHLQQLSWVWRRRQLDSDEPGHHLIKQIEREIRILQAGWTPPVHQSASIGIQQLLVLTESLAEEGRADDAAHTMIAAMECFRKLAPFGDTLGLYGEFWELGLRDFRKRDGRLLRPWLCFFTPIQLLLEDEPFMQQVLTIAAERQASRRAPVSISRRFFEKCANGAVAAQVMGAPSRAVHLTQAAIETLAKDDQVGMAEMTGVPESVDRHKRQLRQVATEVFIQHLGEAAPEFRLPEEVAFDPEFRALALARALRWGSNRELVLDPESDSLTVRSLT